MDKPEIILVVITLEMNRLSDVPQIKAVTENKNFLELVSAIKKKEEYHPIERYFGIYLNRHLKEFGTSLEKLEEETDIPKNIIKEFLIEFIKKQVFPI